MASRDTMTEKSVSPEDKTIVETDTTVQHQTGNAPQGAPQGDAPDKGGNSDQGGEGK